MAAGKASEKSTKNAMTSHQATAVAEDINDNTVEKTEQGEEMTTPAPTTTTDKKKKTKKTKNDANPTTARKEESLYHRNLRAEMQKLARQKAKTGAPAPAPAAEGEGSALFVIRNGRRTARSKAYSESRKLRASRRAKPAKGSATASARVEGGKTAAAA